jgi:hypothetical protein
LSLTQKLGLRLVEASLRLGEQKGAFCKGLTVFTARRYYCSFVKKGIDQGCREDLNGGGLIRSFFVTTDHITAIAAKLENI